MVAALFQKAGHDVSTVPQQNLCSAPDPTIMEICRTEQRCLVSLDLDFGNPFIFDPSKSFGIAVFRLPSKTTKLEDILNLTKTLLAGLQKQSIDRKLWIVELNRIREYQPE